MASPLDMNKFTAKERNAAKKELLKKIDAYNRQMKKAKEPAFPLSSPTTDLVYKGVVKFTYNTGFAVQATGALVDSSMLTTDVIDKLIDRFRLTGGVDDYQLQEINHATQDVRVIGNAECPLSIQLQYGPLSNMLELRLVRVQQTTVPRGGQGNNIHRTHAASDDEDDDGLGNNRDVTPKDEVIDHGFANIEATINEALEDIPPLVRDIQEGLKLLSNAVSTAKMPLPPRRALWDQLKPQVSALVKDIRHLVDNGEFLATRHCPSNECRLIMTLLLELITDYSRELIVVSKEMCGLKGAAKTDFTVSLNSFNQHITHISQLVSKMADSLHAVALSGHLLHTTAPENFIKGSLKNDSYFSGSGGVSGILVFATITAYLGLIRGAYEDKSDYYASLASNMLQCGNKVLETIQKTNEYDILHTHPLQTRVADMERKLKISMNTLVKKVKNATCRKPAPVSVPEMLLAGHTLITATLDFLMVAQCASLLHKIAIKGWEVLDLPWVKGWVLTSSSSAAGGEISHQRTDSDPHTTTTASSTISTDQVSSSSDTQTEKSYDGTTSTASSAKRRSRERKSRIPTQKKDSGNSDTTDHDEEAEGNGMGFSKITLQPGSLPLYQGVESGEDADDEGGESLTPSRKTSSVSYDPRSEAEDESRSRSRSFRSGSGQNSLKQLPPHATEKADSTQYMGNAIKRLKQHHTLNMAIARIAEGLLVSLIQKINLLSQDKSLEHCHAAVEEIIGIAKQIRDEVSSMECDVISGKSMEELLDQSRINLNTSIRDVHLFISVQSVTEKDKGRLMGSLSHLHKVSAKTVGDALTATKEHKKALIQAEKLEQEFVSLVTGKNTTALSSSSIVSSSPSRSKRKISITTKLESDTDAESVVLENISSKGGTMPGSVLLAKNAPKVVGGTKQQLMHRLTYHKSLDPEFVESFILVFHKYIPASELLQMLLEKFCLNTPRNISSDGDKEAFESEIAIPIRLRVIHALRLWTTYHSSDFTDDESLGGTLETFLQLIEESMATSCRQLRMLLRAGGESGSHHTMTPVAGHIMTPQPILPLAQENGKKFDILDCNSLELARQLCMMYSNAFSRIKLKEFLTLAWVPSDDPQSMDEIINKIPGICRVQLISKQISRFVTRRLLAETNEDNQLILLSYFIKSAESCLNLKNFEAVYAIYKGLTTDSIKGAISSPWQSLSDQEIHVFKTLRDTVSSDKDFGFYRSQLKKIDQIPFVLQLGVFLTDFHSIHSNNPDYIPGKPDTFNFHKWKCFARLLTSFHQQKCYPYNFSSIQIVQEFLSKFEVPITEEQWVELDNN